MQNKKFPKKLLFDAPQLDNDENTSKAHFSFELKLGDGAFGQVWRVKHKKTNKIYACKQVAKDRVLKMLDQFRREVFIMYELSHPHIIKLYHHFEDVRYFYLIMEIAEGGNLFQKLANEKNFIEKTAHNYFLQILSAVEYLHSHSPQIIHRDIKPENILLDKKGILKLTDFGWSNYYSQEEGVPRFTMCGTYEYLSPEMVKEAGHTTAVDIWCLGILLFEMLCGFTPFKGSTKDTIIENITKKKVKFPRSISTESKDLILKILEKNPTKRMSIEEIKEHAWVVKKSVGKPPEPVTPKKIEVKNNSKDVESQDSAAKYEIYPETLRNSIGRIKSELSITGMSTKELREKIITANKQIREITRNLKLTEERILKRRIETLDLDHNIREHYEFINDATIQLEKMQSNINLDSLREKRDKEQEKFDNKNEESLTSKEKIKDLTGELDILNENILNRSRYSDNLKQYLKKLKAKGSCLHRSRLSQVSDLAASREFLKTQISEHEKIVELIETPETKTLRELMHFVKTHSEKVISGFIIEEKIKGIEDGIVLKEYGMGKIRNEYNAEKSSILKNARMEKDKLLKKTLEIGMVQEEKNKELYRKKDKFRTLLNESRVIEKKFLLECADLGHVKEVIAVSKT
jgi:serine/threonine protein kinase